MTITIMVGPSRSKAVAAMKLLPPADSLFVARATMAVVLASLMVYP